MDTIVKVLNEKVADGDAKTIVEALKQIDPNAEGETVAEVLKNMELGGGSGSGGVLGDITIVNSSNSTGAITIDSLSISDGKVMGPKSIRIPIGESAVAHLPYYYDADFGITYASAMLNIAKAENETLTVEDSNCEASILPPSTLNVSGVYFDEDESIPPVIVENPTVTILAHTE